MRPFGFGLLVVVACQIAGSPAGWSEDVVDPYDALYDVIMIRHGADGKTYGRNSPSPLIWRSSSYLLEGDAHQRLIAALDRFNLLSRQQIDAYSDFQRAILQRHLWAVFDWATVRRGLAFEPEPAEMKSLRFVIQSKVAPLLKRLALSEERIRELPDPMKATAESGVFAETYDAQDALKPFFANDLDDDQGPWVCLAKLDHRVPAINHTDAVTFRSAFLIFLQLPGGREQTLAYLKTLASFRDPWVIGERKKNDNIAEHPAASNLHLHVNPLTPQFPVGTQVALVEQALLIDDQGELVLSPLIESIQLRAFLTVDLKYDFSQPVQALAEFVMQPRAMINGDATMRAIAADEVRYTTTFLSDDPFENPKRTGDNPRLSSCLSCHRSAGIHSLNSRVEIFQNASLLPPRFVASSPQTIGNATASMKRSDYSWGLLQGLWRD